MPKFIFNKLIRDKLWDIMKGRGVTIEEKDLTPDEFIYALKNKLKEESDEVFEAKTTEELKEEIADVQEVLIALCKAADFNMQEIEDIRQKKNEKKGGFNISKLGLSVTFEENTDKLKEFADYLRNDPKKYPEI
jgi:predicted house-cleaning noncanonical NTP pyrophosphatase (MazG superfamily)